jgi:hypothetical protein
MRRYADHALPNNLKLPAFLARRLGAHITITVGLDSFRFEGPGLRARNGYQAATALRIGDDLTLAAIGDEALAPDASGLLVRPFEMPPRRGDPWLGQEFLVQYCRYYLRLTAADSTRHGILNIGPAVTVRKAESLRSFFRGQETEVLDGVLRAAGASTVQFLS